MQNIDGVVVLYNPTDQILDNIESYVEDLRTLFVVDNSSQYNTTLISRLKKVSNIVYVDMKGNKGIAAALNTGAARAVEREASWLLTMDQDSRFENGALRQMFVHTGSSSFKKEVGIISAEQQVTGLSLFDPAETNELVDMNSVMTSGNLVNLDIYKKVGPFFEPYFIDCVDHEYCLRLKKFKYRVVMCRSSRLQHALGDTGAFSFIGKTLYFTNHSAVRRYYMTRNRLDLIFRYFLIAPKFTLFEARNMVIEWLKIILFERDKGRKSFAIVHGFYHFLVRRFGKL